MDFFFTVLGWVLLICFIAIVALIIITIIVVVRDSSESIDYSSLVSRFAEEKYRKCKHNFQECAGMKALQCSKCSYLISQQQYIKYFDNQPTDSNNGKRR